MPGNPDKVIRLKEKYEYDVRTRGDSYEEYAVCSIRDICVLPRGQVLVADAMNNNVKLLNQQYKVLSHCVKLDTPSGIFQITPSEVGVTSGSVVQFIKVN
ncbi:hypothetical protein DPMN_045007 [Dreissena polymorpha]|uniref:Uncharacterized protein n=1 Tax=Dreissena polymorpha TaxID=45954 RepID=A0A9D4D3H7_DREPO|nr:hypothetical protein DPMN_045007 [Dreissena polymorpha]